MSITDDQSLETMIDQTLADSFPASDPPAWTLGRQSQSNRPLLFITGLEIGMSGKKQNEEDTVPSARPG
ncbi:MAG: hypothetical protein L0Z50_10810 [Verrucomicrobiales bacterium]|nr:hypothetical protein [Verrucomicrobiales bacterium]